MAIPVKRMLRTRGALVAAITALAVGLTLTVGRLLVQLVALVDPTTAAAARVPSTQLLATVLPFAVGYFVALWVIAPITEHLRIGHVITRAMLSTGVGATLWFVVLGIVQVIAAIAGASGVFGLAASPLLVSAQLGGALVSALTALITLLPLGVLGGVLQWVWRTSHPAEHHIEGLIDV